MLTCSAMTTTATTPTLRVPVSGTKAGAMEGGAARRVCKLDPLLPLLPLVLSGDPAASSLFYHHALPLLRAVAWQYLRLGAGFTLEDHDDFCQEAAARVFAKLGSYRGDSKLSVWIYAVAKNHARMELRRRVATSRGVAAGAGRTISLDAPAAELGGGGNAPAAASYSGYDTRTVGDLLGRRGEQDAAAARLDCARLLADLPPCHRTALRQFYLEGRTHREAAERAGIVEGTQKAYAARGLERARRTATKAEQKGIATAVPVRRPYLPSPPLLRLRCEWCKRLFEWKPVSADRVARAGLRRTCGRQCAALLKVWENARRAAGMAAREAHDAI